MGKVQVKVVSIPYGLLGNPNNRRIEKATQKWMGKGYGLKTREDSPPGCFGFGGKTHLTFIKEV